MSRKTCSVSSSVRSACWVVCEACSSPSASSTRQLPAPWTSSRCEPRRSGIAAGSKWSPKRVKNSRAPLTVVGARLALRTGWGACAARGRPGPGAAVDRHLQAVDAFGEDRRRLLVSARLEAGEQPDQEPRRARRPGLGAARGRVVDGDERPLAGVAGERLGQPLVEELRGLQDRERDPGCLRVESVAREPGGDQRVVVRPDGSEVIADRVVAAVALGHRAYAPAGKQARPDQVAATLSALSPSTMPLQSRRPILDVSESTGRLSPSRARAK